MNRAKISIQEVNNTKDNPFEIDCLVKHPLSNIVGVIIGTSHNTGNLLFGQVKICSFVDYKHLTWKISDIEPWKGTITISNE